MLWDKRFDRGDFTRGNSFVRTRDGGYLIVGDAEIDTPWYAWRALCVIKTNVHGESELEKIEMFGEAASGRSALQTPDGLYTIAGYTDTATGNSRDVFLLRLDENLNTVWYKTYGGTGSDVANHVELTDDGGYIIAGRTQLPGTNDQDVLLIKTDAAGEVVWQEHQEFGGANSDSGNCVVQCSDGGYLIAGSTTSFGAGRSDVLVIKTDASGNESWKKTFGDVENDHGNYLRHTQDGRYVIVGSTQSPETHRYRVLLIKLEASGNEIWQETFSFSDSDRGIGVEQASNGAYIIAGTAVRTGVAPVDLLLVYFQPYEWDAAYKILFDKPFYLPLFRQYRDEVLKRTREGRNLTDAIYRSSEESLIVLLKNPTLLWEAKQIVEANREAVVSVLRGEKGIIHDTDRIIAFLDAYTDKSEGPPKKLAIRVKQQMQRHAKANKPLFGFELRKY
jgi:hypothetical protein